jgi:hypothetical protein
MNEEEVRRAVRDGVNESLNGVANGVLVAICVVALFTYPLVGLALSALWIVWLAVLRPLLRAARRADEWVESGRGPKGPDPEHH